LTTVTRLDQNMQKAQAYLDKIDEARYSWWTGGHVPDGAPAWAKNGPPPQPADVRGTSCFCAGVTNLARRAVGLDIPTLGNPNYDGGVVAYFGSTDAAPPGLSPAGLLRSTRQAAPVRPRRSAATLDPHRAQVP
jgi:hypothetical protein